MSHDEREPVSFSKGFQNLLWQLPVGSRPEGQLSFPEGVKAEHLRSKRKESVKEWLNRCIADGLCGEREKCMVENSLAVFLRLKWGHKRQLEGGSIIAVRTEGSVPDFLEGNVQVNHYFRLDLEPSELGSPFSHPVPHIHIQPNEGPRFAMETIASGNIVIDMFEWIYRHYYPENWLEWAQDTWYRYAHEHRIGGAVDLFASIKALFKEGRWEVLVTQHRETISHMKQSWRSAKDSMFDLRIDHEICRTLTYPAFEHRRPDDPESKDETGSSSGNGHS